jgi:hypothetical protein
MNKNPARPPILEKKLISGKTKTLREFQQGYCYRKRK